MNNQRRRKYTASRSSLIMALVICAAAALTVALLFFDSHFICVNGTAYGSDTKFIDLRGARTIDVGRLCNIKGLEKLDLRDSLLTEEQADRLRENLPGCEVLWSVPIAGQLADSDAVELELKNPSEEDFALLRFFDNLETGNVSDCELYDYMQELSSGDNSWKLVWTVPIGGREYKSTTVSIKLPDATAEDIDQLRYLPNLDAVEMSGCEEYEKIMEFAESRPDCAVNWTVDVLGQQVSSRETELDLSGTKISDVSELEKNLAYLPKLERLILCDCGLSNETLHELNQRQESIKVVWRVYFGKWSLRTDATAFSTQQPEKPSYKLVDDEVRVLKYCTDLEMLDLGHQALTSVEPFADLTNLKVLILADNRISDISPLYKLTKMEYFEMFINRIDDISVVQYMPNLTDVNFCWNRISDPSPLYDHEHLERVWMCGGQMSGATKQEFMAQQPDVIFDLYSTYGSTNGSWRTCKNFGKIREGFRQHNGMNDYHW